MKGTKPSAQQLRIDAAQTIALAGCGNSRHIGNQCPTNSGVCAACNIRIIALLSAAAMRHAAPEPKT